MVTYSRRLLRKKAKALGKPVRDNALRWLIDHADVFGAIARAAIEAAENATAQLHDEDRRQLRLPSEVHLVCEILAQVALALDEAIKEARKVVSHGVIPDRWHGYGPTVVTVLRALVDKLTAKAMDYTLEATGLASALRMAPIGAVVACPNIDDHPAVKACGAPLVKEPVTDGLAGSLRQMAARLAV